ncbi:fluoride efflux transporter CrcB [Ktedonospora formicarum]|uniref:Fluoride-specific ion channel FluC n=1 Tax=Ktedonospora formicarum TaxID=2778364 RepID=A0A8J3I4Z8_9CHLR|nr:fluoride efflux transporter CrcB [Ktedonospora formicarum]GHO46038.1 putative fluoride ion transporter CrcB 2 [Ktedonospora formicarum]
MLVSLLLFTGVGIAGACGSVARYLLGRIIMEHMKGSFPWGTFVINVTGAWCIGLVFALAGQHVLSKELQTVLATGFLGGYTTFSTMHWEGVQLMRGGRRFQGIFYLIVTYMLGLSMEAVGMWLGWEITR